MMRRWRNERSAGCGVPQTCDVLRDFRGRQLAALAWLRALRHFDLDFIGVHQVFRGHAESSRRYLLDPVVSLRSIVINTWILATFAGIAASSKVVHRNSQGLMGFGGNCSKRHSLCAEAAEQRNFA